MTQRSSGAVGSIPTYLFLRYLNVLLRIFIPLASYLLPVLLPLNFIAEHGSHRADGLDRFTWTNVAPAHTRIYLVHLVLSILVIFWVWRVLWYEVYTYECKRQQQMEAQKGATVLITDLPTDLATEETLKAEEILKEQYSSYPGRVKTVSLHKDYRGILRMIQERDALTSLLGGAETRLIRQAARSHCRGNGARQRSVRIGGNSVDGGDTSVEGGETLAEHGENWRLYLSADQREHSWRPLLGGPWLPAVPFQSRKVDLIADYQAVSGGATRELEIRPDPVQRATWCPGGMPGCP